MASYYICNQFQVSGRALKGIGFFGLIPDIKFSIQHLEKQKFKTRHIQKVFILWPCCRSAFDIRSDRFETPTKKVESPIQIDTKFGNHKQSFSKFNLKQTNLFYPQAHLWFKRSKNNSSPLTKAQQTVKFQVPNKVDELEVVFEINGRSLVS